MTTSQEPIQSYNLAHSQHRHCHLFLSPWGSVDEHICLELDGCSPSCFTAPRLMIPRRRPLRSCLDSARHCCNADVFLTYEYRLTFTCKALCKFKLGLLEMGSPERPADELLACPRQPAGMGCGLRGRRRRRRLGRGVVVVGGGLFAYRKKRVIEPRPISIETLR